MSFRSNSVNTTQYNLQQQLRMCLTSVDHQDIIIIRWRVDDFSVRPLPVQVIIEPTPSGFKGLGMNDKGTSFKLVVTVKNTKLLFFTVTTNLKSKIVASVIF